MRWFLGGALVLLLTVEAGAADWTVQVDKATVTTDRRANRTWTVLDSQVSVDAPKTREALAAVIEDWDAYPRLFPNIKEVHVETGPGATLLTERVVVSVLALKSANLFTLRIIRTDAADGRSQRYDWTQAAADESIDDLSGFWSLEDKGTADKPLTRVVYHTRSAVPEQVPGQAWLVSMFLGTETKAVLEAVVKSALSK